MSLSHSEHQDGIGSMWWASLTVAGAIARVDAAIFLPVPSVSKKPVIDLGLHLDSENFCKRS